MNLSRKMIALIVGILLIVLGAGSLIDLIGIHKNIMSLLIIVAGVMLLREAR